MKVFYLVPVLLFLVCPGVFAQNVHSPEIHPDGTITVRLEAPPAQNVSMQYEDMHSEKTLPMTKDAAGMWSVNTPALAPDMYDYRFVVDGLTVIDPNSHHFVINHFAQGGLFIVPGTPPEAWEETDVPHGEVHHHFYHSALVGDRRDFYVYTPPKFDRKKKYPVLYLLHGYSDMANGSVISGRANFILDNLIAQGKAKPMLVVMPLGYGAPKLLENGWNIAHDPLWEENIKRFADTLLTEVMPQVEEEYPVVKDAKGRAIAGLSMGGAETMYTGLNHPDKFAWIGPMSSAIFDDPRPWFPELDAKRMEKVKLLWIACGKEDGLLKGNQHFEQWLASKNIKYTAVETDGAHAWQVWRRNLEAFAQLIFKD